MFFLDTQTSDRYYLKQPFTYNGLQYSKAGATEETFLGLGFTKVTIDPRPDSRFYVVTGPSDSGTWTTTPRDLAELKTKYITQTKQEAFDLIKGTDWYVIRLLELGADDAPIPVDVTTFRASVRNASNSICLAIDACASVDDLEFLINNPVTNYPAEPETGVYY